MEYTVHGDTADAASHIEGVTKDARARSWSPSRPSKRSRPRSAPIPSGSSRYVAAGRRSGCERSRTGPKALWASRRRGERTDVSWIGLMRPPPSRALSAAPGVGRRPAENSGGGSDASGRTADLLHPGTLSLVIGRVPRRNRRNELDALLAQLRDRSFNVVAHEESSCCPAVRPIPAPDGRRPRSAAARKSASHRPHPRPQARARRAGMRASRRRPRQRESRVRRQSQRDPQAYVGCVDCNSAPALTTVQVSSC